MSVDRLVPELGGGDLFQRICADDPLTVAHAQRMLLKDSRAFVSPRWVQNGFRRAYGIERPGANMRNLFGQVEGTTNPSPRVSNGLFAVMNTCLPGLRTALDSHPQNQYQFG